MFDDEKATNGNGTTEEISPVEHGILETMAKAGVLFGRRKARTNPRMHRYIFTTRNGAEILDIIQTVPLVEAASKFLGDVTKKRGTILFVGTTPAARDLVRALADKFGAPFVTERWLGGTLTNWKTLKERISYFTKLKADRAAGKLEKYTKKERLDFDKEIERLTHLFDGIEFMNQLPQAVCVVGASSHEITIREARRMNIPVVAIASTDADPNLIDYLVPANDQAKSSVKWVLDQFEKAIEEAKKEAVNLSAETKK